MLLQEIARIGSKCQYVVIDIAGQDSPSARRCIAMADTRGAKALIDATQKWDYPGISLPPRDMMDRVAKEWEAYGLPHLDKLNVPGRT